MTLPPGFEDLEEGSSDELDTYEDGDGPVSESDVLECLRTEHKDSWHVRYYSFELQLSERRRRC